MNFELKSAYIKSDIYNESLKRFVRNKPEFPEREVRMIKGSFKPNSKVLIARAFGKRQENGGIGNFNTLHISNIQ